MIQMQIIIIVIIFVLIAFIILTLGADLSLIDLLGRYQVYDL